MLVLYCLSGLIGPPRPKVGQVRTVAPGGGAAGGRWAGADIQRPTCKNMHAFARCARARTQLGKRRRESAKKVVAREARRSPRGSYIYAVVTLRRESLFAAAMAGASAAGTGWRLGSDPDSALRSCSIIAMGLACAAAAVCEFCAQCLQRPCFAAWPFWAARDGRCAARAGRG